MRITQQTCGVDRSSSRATLIIAAILIGLAFVVQSAFAGAPAGPSGCPTKTTRFENATSQAVPDLSTTTSTITVSGLDTYLWDVDLITRITHNYSGDLEITLTSPEGTVVTITMRNGGAYRNLFAGTRWDDDASDTNAPGPVTEENFVSHGAVTPLCPEEAMGAFIGENPNGVWTLTVYDSTTGDAGSLNSWSLGLTTLPQAPTVNLPLESFDLSGAALPDNTTTTTTLTMNGSGNFVGGVTLLTYIQHPRCQDLDITLTSPAGTTVTITTDNGGDNDNLFDDTQWSDKAGHSNPPGAVTDTVFEDGVAERFICPEGAMAAFIGEDPTGTWTLTITDDQAGEAGWIRGSQLVVDIMTYPDTDGDGVIDPIDVCNGSDDNADADGDGVADGCDQCPDDANKTLPGICGCGVADADADGDGLIDCLNIDLCPDDPDKTLPGTCGCGVADTDSDGDGVSNCWDDCPNDPNKIAPGACGCGAADDDFNNDGIPDCLDIDLCPDDPDKTLPGFCGCGVADTDSDGDGIPDCFDTDATGNQENPGGNNGDAGPFAFCGLGTAACLPLMIAGLGLMRHRVRRRRRK